MRNLLPILFLAFPALAFGGIIHVPADEATIQAGIEAAAPGDTVLVADGTYIGPGNCDIELRNKDLLVAAASGNPDSCVIDCDSSTRELHRGFWAHEGESASTIVRGFTIRNGGAADHGGGILCEPDSLGAPSEPTIRNCVVTACEAPEGAGLAVLGPGASLRLEMVQVHGNTGDGALLDDDVNDSEIHDSVFRDNSGNGIVVQGINTGYFGIHFENCDFLRNGLAGLEVSVAFSNVRLDSCLVEDNLGWGVLSFTPQDLIFQALDSTIQGNGLGGIRNYSIDIYSSLVRCEIQDNRGPGIDDFGSISFSASDCLVQDNDSFGIGYGSAGRGEPPLAYDYRSLGITGCEVRNNGGRGIEILYGGPVLFEIHDNLVVGNGGEGIYLSASWTWIGHEYSFLHNTVTRNQGDGIVYDSDVPCTIESCLVTFNEGVALQAVQLDSLVVACSDFYGNAGGDWIGNAAGFAGLDGNFSANPLYCDETDFLLAENSPCLPGSLLDGADCGQIGYAGQACGSITYDPARVAVLGAAVLHLRPGTVIPLSVAVEDLAGAVVPDEGTPPSLTGSGPGLFSPLTLQTDPVWTWHSSYTAAVTAGQDLLVAHDPESTVSPEDSLLVDVTEAAIITSVSDVGNDQGRQVRVIFAADLHDSVGSAVPITQYVIWRRVDDLNGEIEPRVVLAPDCEAIAAALAAGTAPPVWSRNGVLWEPVGPAIPGMMWPEYASVVPTLADSTSAGIHCSVFQVSAHTLQPQVYFVSAPDSGYSVDNLAPMAPEGLVVSYAAGHTELSWQASPDVDFDHFAIYRSTDPGFVPGSESRRYVTSATSWLDDDSMPWHYHYRVSSWDFAGNESAAADPVTITAVTEVAAPARFRLASATPNPFNPTTVIAYEVPQEGGTIRLGIYNLQGRLVRTLVSGVSPGGRHEVVWDGRQDRGGRASSGVYFCRLEARGVVEAIKITMVQ